MNMIWKILKKVRLTHFGTTFNQMYIILCELANVHYLNRASTCIVLNASCPVRVIQVDPLFFRAGSGQRDGDVLGTECLV